MKVTMFAQAPYRYLPDDFETDHESVCSVPYSLTTREGVYSSMRDFMDELMLGARSGFDAVAVTEHGQSSYDMVPNPDLVAGALAYMTEAEGLDVGIYPMGRSLGKSREPLRVAEEYAMIDVMSGGRLVPGLVVGLSYDASINNGVPPMEVRRRFDENLELVLRAWREQTPFAFNGRFSQYPMVNMWPRPLQQNLPVWITGIGNPATMQMCLLRGFGFNYLSWFGAKLTGQRIFDRFWEIADQVGVPRNPYRLGFLQTIAISETDERAEQEYGAHLEYAFRKGLGSIPMEKLALPGNIDIRGVQAILKDPGDFGLYSQMKTATYRDLVEAGVVIAGSPATVRDQLVDFCRSYGIGNLHAMLGFGSLPRHLVMKNIQLFSEEVLPHLRDLWTDTEHQHHWWPERLGGSPADVHVPTSDEMAGAR
ncbi:LLM class flavin-dependent oxidoreductase [Kribbella sp. NBC_00382]|uniref:LLM class flavin-dependent oxidoreductase n=1 Tax=Kribbella sp. NBC_00382 TaxID=2975967 RepID=UPI002E218166